MNCNNVNNIEDESEIDDNNIIVNESQYHYRDDDKRVVDHHKSLIFSSLFLGQDLCVTRCASTRM